MHPQPSQPGARGVTMWTVGARMGAVRALSRQLRQDGIEIVTLDSTSNYWRIWFFLLEACGLAVQLVSASQAKNLLCGCVAASWLEPSPIGSRNGSQSPFGKFGLIRWSGAPLRNRTVDLLLTMHAGFV